MASRSKEKMAAAFRRLFSSSDKSPGSPQAEKQCGGGGGRVRGGDTVGQSEQGQSQGPAHKGVRARRLMKELRDIQRAQAANNEPVFTVSLVQDNLFEWHVRLSRSAVDPESELAEDMRRLAVPHLLLHILFPDNFPFAPPFVRVVSPRIERGFVMDGGAICMELLTPRGWASAYTVEAVLVQFAASLVKGQGRIASKGKGEAEGEKGGKGKGKGKEFSRRSAEESFRSLVKTHDKYGWVTPPLSDG